MPVPPDNYVLLTSVFFPAEARTRCFWTRGSRVHSFYADDTWRCNQLLGEWHSENLDVYTVSDHATALFLRHAFHYGNKWSPLTYLYLCSPRHIRACRGSDEGPAATLRALQALRATGHPASVGGFRRLSQAEFATYQLMHTLESPIEAKTIEAAKAHPVWPAMQAHAANTSAAAAVLCRIIDPRNHINPLLPDRMSPLRAHCSCSALRTMQAAFRTREATATRERYSRRPTIENITGGPLAAAARLDLLNWLGIAMAGDRWLCNPLDLVASLDEAPLILQSRILDLKNQATHGRIDVPRWWLGGSQHFLRFIRDYWLDVSADRRRESHRLCDLRQYFPTEETMARWQAHVQQR